MNDARLLRWLSVAGLVVGLGACTGDNEEPPPPSPETTTFAPEEFTEPPDGGELVVAETGFSESPRTTGDTSADLLSWGVVIENTSSEYVAFGGILTVRLLDAEGNPIDELSGEPSDQPVARLPDLSRVLPGERVGLGRTTPHYGADVADLEVVLETTVWQPVYEDFWWAHPITASNVATQHANDGSTISFTVDAAYTDDMLRGQLSIGGTFAAVFRDAGGEVVGGAECCQDDNLPVPVPPGQSDSSLTLADGIPPQADDTRTEVFLPNPQEQLPD